MSKGYTLIKKKQEKKTTFLHDYYCRFRFVVEQTYFISSIYSSFQIALFMWLKERPVLAKRSRE